MHGKAALFKCFPVPSFCNNSRTLPNWRERENGIYLTHHKLFDMCTDQDSRSPAAGFFVFDGRSQETLGNTPRKSVIARGIVDDQLISSCRTMLTRMRVENKLPSKLHPPSHEKRNCHDQIWTAVRAFQIQRSLKMRELPGDALPYLASQLCE